MDPLNDQSNVRTTLDLELQKEHKYDNSNKSTFTLEAEKNPEKKLDKSSIKYEKTFNGSSFTCIITLILVILILTYPFWMSLIILENVRLSKVLMDTTNTIIHNNNSHL